LSIAPHSYEVIIVDYDSPDDITDILKQNYSKFVNIIYVKCRRLPIFNLSRARNIGGRAAVGDWFLFVDVDTKLSPEAISILLELSQKPDVYFAAVDSAERKQIINGGFIFVPEAKHKEIFGFNEDLKGWGYEDIDYKRRLESAGLLFSQVPASIYDCIDHSDNDRTKHYDVGKELSWMINKQESKRTWSNPEFGVWSDIQSEKIICI